MGAAAPTAEAADAPSPIKALMDEMARGYLRESPEFATFLAVPEEMAGGRYVDRLGEVSREAGARFKGMIEQGLQRCRAIDRAALHGQDVVSQQVVEAALADLLATLQFEHAPTAGQPYVVSQLTGSYTGIPDFLVSAHQVPNRDHADAYLARLAQYARNLDIETQRHREDVAAGVTPPDFAIDKAITQLETFAAIAPAENPLVATFAAKLARVEDMPEADRAALTERAQTILTGEVLPAYHRQVAALRATRPHAAHDAGCWRLPQGAEMYAASLQQQTTTNMTADEIHTMGVELVQSLQSEMEAILRAEGLTRGTVAERVREISARPDQIYPSTEEGRTALLDALNAQVQAVRARMPEVFGNLARANLEIKRVPEYTEAGSPGGYYQPPALDGSRPGAYYINLRDPATEWPKFTLPTLTYHEGIPGHHWQIALAQESEGLPFFRSALLGFNAYQEGWGLYAEQLADEMGMYANDRLGRLGYLQSAAFRASRLVVDTGMHAKRWTREQAIDSMMAATGDQESNIVTEIERYSVWPGQACGYMVGRQAIVAMREHAKTVMGAQFDIRGFHDVVLSNGATPLSVTRALVEEWVAATGGMAAQ